MLGLAILLGGLLAAGASTAGAVLNYQSQKETNAANAKAQAAVNAQNQFNMEHAHQIEMADLKAAGLNPVLTAMGGQGAPMASLNAPRATAPNLDLSGVSSAINGMTNAVLMTEMMNAKIDAAKIGASSRTDSASIRAGSNEKITDKWINAKIEKRAKEIAKDLISKESSAKALLGNAKDVKRADAIAKQMGIKKGTKGISWNDFFKEFPEKKDKPWWKS